MAAHKALPIALSFEHGGPCAPTGATAVNIGRGF